MPRRLARAIAGAAHRGPSAVDASDDLLGELSLARIRARGLEEGQQTGGRLPRLGHDAARCGSTISRRHRYPYRSSSLLLQCRDCVLPRAGPLYGRSTLLVQRTVPRSGRADDARWIRETCGESAPS